MQKKRKSESERVKEFLDGFDSAKSKIISMLNDAFNEIPSHAELLTIAIHLSKEMNLPKLPRVCKRNNECLLKWLDDNRDKIHQRLKYLSFGENSDGPS